MILLDVLISEKFGIIKLLLVEQKISNIDTSECELKTQQKVVLLQCYRTIFLHIYGLSFTWKFFKH